MWSHHTSGWTYSLTVKEWVRRIFRDGSEFSGLCFLMDGNVMYWDDIPKKRNRFAYFLGRILIVSCTYTELRKDLKDRYKFGNHTDNNHRVEYVKASWKKKEIRKHVQEQKPEDYHSVVGDWRKPVSKEGLNWIPGEERGSEGDCGAVEVKRIHT